VRLAAGGWGRTVRPLCRRSCAGGGIPIRSPAAMVRKGSPVRVRQSALAKPLETAAFLVLGIVDAASAGARGPSMAACRPDLRPHAAVRNGPNPPPEWNGLLARVHDDARAEAVRARTRACPSPGRRSRCGSRPPREGGRAGRCRTRRASACSPPRAPIRGRHAGSRLTRNIWSRSATYAFTVS
jgi:hypothetical protein